MEEIGFFEAIPQAIAALWDFGNGFLGVAVSVGSILIVAGCVAAAVKLRETHPWTGATFGSIAALVAGFWLFGIIPSAWIYFADGEQDLLSGTLIPSAIGFGEGRTVMSNFYGVFRDIVVATETMVAMVAMGAVALYIQKRFPRGLAEGEEKRSSSGGYK